MSRSRRTARTNRSTSCFDTVGVRLRRTAAARRSVALRRPCEQLSLRYLIRVRANHFANAARIGNAAQGVGRRHLVRGDDHHAADAEDSLDEALAELCVIDVAQVDVLDGLRRDAALQDYAL